MNLCDLVNVDSAPRWPLQEVFDPSGLSPTVAKFARQAHAEELADRAREWAGWMDRYRGMSRFRRVTA